MDDYSDDFEEGSIGACSNTADSINFQVPKHNNSNYNEEDEYSYSFESASLSPAKPLVGNIIPIGSTVKVFWKEENDWFFGRVQKVDEHKKAIFVLYDDGDEAWEDISNVSRVNSAVGLEETQALSSSHSALLQASMYSDSFQSESMNSNGVRSVTPIETKERVQVFWPNEGQWFNGIVLDKDSLTKKYFIRYDDGDEAWEMEKDIRKQSGDKESYSSFGSAESKGPSSPRSHSSSCDPRRANSCSTVNIDDTVRVYWEDEKAWFEGTVKQMDAFNRKVFVVYTDGDEAWEEIKYVKVTSTSTGKRSVCKKQISLSDSSQVSDSSKQSFENDGDWKHRERVEVFWPLENAWFSGTIKAIRGEKCLILYDDGDEAWENSTSIRKHKRFFGNDAVGKRVSFCIAENSAILKCVIECYNPILGYRIACDHGEKEWRKNTEGLRFHSQQDAENGDFSAFQPRIITPRIYTAILSTHTSSIKVPTKRESQSSGVGWEGSTIVPRKGYQPVVLHSYMESETIESSLYRKESCTQTVATLPKTGLNAIRA